MMWYHISLLAGVYGILFSMLFISAMMLRVHHRAKLIMCILAYGHQNKDKEGKVVNFPRGA